MDDAMKSEIADVFRVESEHRDSDGNLVTQRTSITLPSDVTLTALPHPFNDDYPTLDEQTWYYGVGEALSLPQSHRLDSGAVSTSYPNISDATKSLLGDTCHQDRFRADKTRASMIPTCLPSPDQQVGIASGGSVVPGINNGMFNILTIREAAAHNIPPLDSTPRFDLATRTSPRNLFGEHAPLQASPVATDEQNVSQPGCKCVKGAPSVVVGGQQEPTPCATQHTTPKGRPEAHIEPFIKSVDRQSPKLKSGPKLSVVDHTDNNRTLVDGVADIKAEKDPSVSKSDPKKAVHSDDKSVIRKSNTKLQSAKVKFKPGPACSKLKQLISVMDALEENDNFEQTSPETDFIEVVNQYVDHFQDNSPYVHYLKRQESPSTRAAASLSTPLSSTTSKKPSPVKKSFEESKISVRGKYCFAKNEKNEGPQIGKLINGSISLVDASVKVEATAVSKSILELNGANVKCEASPSEHTTTERALIGTVPILARNRHPGSQLTNKDNKTAIGSCNEHKVDNSSLLFVADNERNSPQPKLMRHSGSIAPSRDTQVCPTDGSSTKLNEANGQIPKELSSEDDVCVKAKTSTTSKSKSSPNTKVKESVVEGSGVESRVQLDSLPKQRSSPEKSKVKEQVERPGISVKRKPNMAIDRPHETVRFVQDKPTSPDNIQRNTVPVASCDRNVIRSTSTDRKFVCISSHAENEKSVSSSDEKRVSSKPSHGKDTKLGSPGHDASKLTSSLPKSNKSPHVKLSENTVRHSRERRDQCKEAVNKNTKCCNGPQILSSKSQHIKSNEDNGGHDKERKYQCKEARGNDSQILSKSGSDLLHQINKEKSMTKNESVRKNLAIQEKPTKAVFMRHDCASPHHKERRHPLVVSKSLSQSSGHKLKYGFNSTTKVNNVAISSLSSAEMIPTQTKLVTHLVHENGRIQHIPSEQSKETPPVSTFAPAKGNGKSVTHNVSPMNTPHTSAKITCVESAKRASLTKDHVSSTVRCEANQDHHKDVHTPTEQSPIDGNAPMKKNVSDIMKKWNKRLGCPTQAGESNQIQHCASNPTKKTKRPSQRDEKYSSPNNPKPRISSQLNDHSKASSNPTETQFQKHTKKLSSDSNKTQSGHKITSPRKHTELPGCPTQEDVSTLIQHNASNSQQEKRDQKKSDETYSALKHQNPRITSQLSGDHSKANSRPTERQFQDHGNKQSPESNTTQSNHKITSPGKHIVWPGPPTQVDISNPVQHIASKTQKENRDQKKGDAKYGALKDQNPRITSQLSGDHSKASSKPTERQYQKHGNKQSPDSNKKQSGHKITSPGKHIELLGCPTQADVSSPTQHNASRSQKESERKGDDNYRALKSPERWIASQLRGDPSKVSSKPKPKANSKPTEIQFKNHENKQFPDSNEKQSSHKTTSSGKHLEKKYDFGKNKTATDQSGAKACVHGIPKKISRSDSAGNIKRRHNESGVELVMGESRAKVAKSDDGGLTTSQKSRLEGKEEKGVKRTGKTVIIEKKSKYIRTEKTGITNQQPQSDGDKQTMSPRTIVKSAPFAPFTKHDPCSRPTAVNSVARDGLHHISTMKPRGASPVTQLSSKVSPHYLAPRSEQAPVVNKEKVESNTNTEITARSKSPGTLNTTASQVYGGITKNGDTKYVTICIDGEEYIAIKKENQMDIPQLEHLSRCTVTNEDRVGRGPPESSNVIVKVDTELVMASAPSVKCMTEVSAGHDRKPDDTVAERNYLSLHTPPSPSGADSSVESTSNETSSLTQSDEVTKQISFPESQLSCKSKSPLRDSGNESGFDESSITTPTEETKVTYSLITGVSNCSSKHRNKSMVDSNTIKHSEHPAEVVTPYKNRDSPSSSSSGESNKVKESLLHADVCSNIPLPKSARYGTPEECSRKPADALENRDAYEELIENALFDEAIGVSSALSRAALEVKVTNKKNTTYDDTRVVSIKESNTQERKSHDDALVSKNYKKKKVEYSDKKTRRSGRAIVSDRRFDRDARVARKSRESHKRSSRSRLPHQYRHHHKRVSSAEKHVRSLTGKLACLQCTETFTSITNLRVHIEEHVARGTMRTAASSRRLTEDAHDHDTPKSETRTTAHLPPGVTSGEINPTRIIPVLITQRQVI